MDICADAVGSLKGATRMFLNDLAALPEEAFDKQFGPKTRTVADIVYEVNLVNDHIGMVIRGEEPFVWQEGWPIAPGDQRSKEAVIKAFEVSSAKMIATAESFSAADLESTVDTEWGKKTKYERCRQMAWHISYHSGQLNFVQTLLGDDDWHW